MCQDELANVQSRKTYPTATVPLREGYAAPAAPPTPNVPTTSRPVSAVPPPRKSLGLVKGYAAPAAPANLRSIDVSKLNIRSAVPSKPNS